MIYSKSWSELDTMHRANSIVLDILRRLKEMVVPGITTADLDRMAEEWTFEAGALPAFKGYGRGNRPYPATLCASVNEEIVHGIPGPRQLKDGDIIGLDMGVIVDGYYGDSAMTVPVGTISSDARRLVDATEKSLDLGVQQVVVGNRVSDIGHAVHSYVKGLGYTVVKEFTGHGIGRALHEDPQVPNYGEPGHGPRISEGMVLAIEPMVCAGRSDVVIADDQWTASTADGSLSAHFERSVAATPKGPWILGESAPAR
ncbi:MAG TPA: type I methionyl aminopeptidase [Candidatus Polarisedimenticolia bacterium]|jgi:methionyl aminopeptidase